MPYLSIFELEFENNIATFEINTFDFCLIAKFCEIMKMPKFGTKNARLGISGLEFKNNIVMFEISTLKFV